MIRRSILLFALSLILFPHLARGADDSTAAIDLMKKAYARQLSILPTQKVAKNDTLPSGWIRAPFYMGAMALFDRTHDEQIVSDMMKIAEASHWKFYDRKSPATGAAVPESWHSTTAAVAAGIQQSGEPFEMHADDLAMGRLYLDLYQLKKDPKMIALLRERADFIVAHAQAGRDLWWWCDSLFMAPPTFAQLSAVTGDRKYIDFMDKQWWDATAFLFDQDEHLYFRDKTYFHKQEKNGKKVFWGRGNGWVMGGIAHVLQQMPKDYPSRPKYEQLLREMSEKLVTLQQPDGFWRASLLDPEAYPGGETSGTGLNCFAMAYGINAGILPRDTYLPVVLSAWKALMTTVQADGKVGWVQPVGAAPAAIKSSDTAQYGTGAFLLAGCEVLKLGRP